MRRRSEDPIETARAWAEEYERSVRDPESWIAGLALEAKASRTPDALARWHTDDLDVVLAYLASHALIDPDLAPRVTASLTALVGWLAESGRLSGAEPGRLVAHLHALRDVVEEALVDPARWSPSKRILMTMQARGYDLGDPRSIERAQAWFNGLPFDERGAIMGLEEEGGGTDHLAALLRQRLGTLPPVVAADEEELDEAARASVWFQRVAGLCAYVGGGLPVTARGNLRLADGRELVVRLQTGEAMEATIGGRVHRVRSTRDLPVLDLVYEVALEAELLELDGSKLRPTSDVALLDSSPHQALHRMVLALMRDIGIVAHRAAGWSFAHPAQVVDEHVPVLLADLYGRPGAVSVPELVADMRSAVIDVMEDEGTPPALRPFLLDQLPRDVDAVVVTLEEFGVLVRGPAGRLALTPFGTWSVREWLGVLLDAPVVGVLTDLPAEQMLLRAGDLPEEVATAEVDAWLGRHGARDLVRALVSAGETGQRLALSALVRQGPAAAAAVEALGAHPGFVEVAEVWRAEVLGERVAPSDDAERVVRLLTAVHRGWGPREVEPWLPRASSSPAAFVDAAWRVRRPETVDVLTALAEAHDRVLAKAARRSLFKLRSLGEA